MKLPASVLEKLKQQGQNMPARSGGSARARSEAERRRRGLDRDTEARPDADAPGDEDAAPAGSNPDDGGPVTAESTGDP